MKWWKFLARPKIDLYTIAAGNLMLAVVLLFDVGGYRPLSDGARAAFVLLALLAAVSCFCRAHHLPPNPPPPSALF